MANTKITELTQLTNPVSTDVLAIVDVGADVTKKISIADLLKNASAGTAAAPGIAFDGDSNTGIYSPGADQVAISTNGTGRLLIDASGNVALGAAAYSGGLTIFRDEGQTTANISTTSNTASFFVARHNSASAGSGGGLIFGAQGGSFAAIKGLLGDGANNTTGSIAFSTRTSSTDGTLSEKLRITSDGKLGLGTSTVEAGHILQANGVIATVTPFGAFSALQTAGGTGFRWTLANDGAYRLQRTTDGFSTVTTPIYIDSSSRVGIGTASPSTLLHAAGAVRVGANDTTDAVLEIGAGATGNRNAYIDLTSDTTYPDYGLRIFRDAGTNSLSYLQHRGTNEFRLITNEAAPLVFWTQAQERVRVSSTGNVGIGTSSPGAGIDLVADGSSNAMTLKLSPPSTAQGRRSTASFYSTFEGSADNGARRTADIVAGFNGGNWGTEFLAFHVGNNGTFNDGQARTIERARIDGSGRLLVGTSTDSGGALLQVNGDRVRIATAKTPASATAAGVAGEICWDASYVYVCVAADTWKRSAIATW